MNLHFTSRLCPPLSHPRLLMTGMIFLLAGFSAHAEKADRDKPTNIEADSVKVDDQKKVQVFEGNVQMTRGTLIFRAERVVVTQDEEGFQHSVATGGTKLPYFRQKREGVDEYFEGEAERIEYSDKTEKTDFYNRAWLKSGKDEVRGQFISYDGKSETYVVTSGPGGTRAKPGSSDRVRAVIQPRATKTPTESPPGGGAALESTQTLGTTLQEKAP